MSDPYSGMGGTKDTMDLLNEFNSTIANKPRTLDSVITAATLLLVSSLRQIGGKHGAERANKVGAGIEKMVTSDDVFVRNFFDDRARMEKPEPPKNRIVIEPGNRFL